MIDLATSQKLFIFILMVSFAVFGILRWLSKMRDEEQVKEAGLQRIGRREFDKFIGPRKFSCMHSPIFSSDTVDHYYGPLGEYNACLFTIVAGRNLTYLTVLIRSINVEIPHFIIKPKSFTAEVRDMLGIKAHHPSLPWQLIDKYDITSTDDGIFVPMLTPEIIAYFLGNEGVWVEVAGDDLMIRHPLKGVRENYETALKRSYDLAVLLPSRPGRRGGHAPELPSLPEG